MKDASTVTWPIKPLGDLCRIELGSTPARQSAAMWDPDRKTENVWLSIADLPQSLHAVATDSKEYVSDLAVRRMRLIPKGTLLVSFKLTLGRLAYAGRDLFSNEAIASLLDVDERKISKKFLYWALTAFDWDKAVEGDQKIKGKTLNKAKLKTIPIPLPSLEEQQRIVAVLDEAFEGLARARTHAEANLQNARELFENFLADQFQYGGAGNRTCTIGDLITLQRGFDITKKDQREGPFPVVSSGGVKSHHDTAVAKAPGVVIGRKGSIGSVYFIEEDFWPHDTTLWVKDFKGNDPQLVYYMMRGLSLIELDTGAANPSLNRNLVHPVVVSWPEENHQSKIATEIYEIEIQALALQQHYSTKLQDLNDLRQSLLQKAFAGELT